MLSIIIAVAVVLFDQISKILVLNNLKTLGSISLIKGVLNFTYVENKGAAFGMLSDSRIVFMIASVLIIVVMCFAIKKIHGLNKFCDIGMGLVLGGGIGNMIDRVRLGFVVDFIDFCAFDFWQWVFNVADSAVVVGCILLIIVFFTDKKILENEDEGRGEENEQ